MKSQIIFLKSHRYSSGFLIMEIMLAFSLFILFSISTFYLLSSIQIMKEWSIKTLNEMKERVELMDIGIIDSTIPYGNDTNIISNSLFLKTKSDYIESWGRNSCFPRIYFNKNNAKYFVGSLDIGSSNPSTDIEVRNDIVYLTANSNSSLPPDFFIIDARDYSNPFILSSLNTGPGVDAIEVAGPYVFLAQASTVSQLQIVDIHDRDRPKIISQLKLPPPNSSTSPPFASSIFYSKGYIYLGTQKWNGPELFIINVSDPYNPVIVGTFETNTLINDIYVRENVAYLATSNELQMVVLDISDKGNPFITDYFSPSGWQTQQGKIFEYFEKQFGLGRTVGGFNVVSNHELFIFSLGQHSSKDIPGGVYGLIIRPPHVFISTNALDQEFQVFDMEFNKIYSLSLNIKPVKMTCDGSSLFFATGNGEGIAILKIN